MISATRNTVFTLLFAAIFAPVASAQQARVNLDWNPLENTENLAPPYGPGIISPDVHADRTVTFKLIAPGADSVAIAPGHDWSTWRHLLYYRLLPGLWR